jgi:hypothetical protein|tara:strand:+ start:120 stop:377 length:258 start_codon:yes stop_codon:yes gene_type:complete
VDVETGIEFQPGDIVIDTVTEEIGLLVERFDVLEHASEDLQSRVFAWEIVWTGKLSRPDNRYMPYTENGLIKCIKDGMLLHISNE